MIKKVNDFKWKCEKEIVIMDEKEWMREREEFKCKRKDKNEKDQCKIR